MSIPYTQENVVKMREVAEYLRGTCKSLEDGLQTEFGEDADAMDFDIELLRELDDAVMNCESCNWWVETGEIDDDGNCTDCQVENDDE